MRSGWNSSIMSSFSPIPTNLMGLPVTARMESAAPPRASPSSLVSMHAVDAQRLIKGGGGVHRILTGHGIHHQQDLCGLHRRLDGLQLVHQGLIDVQPSGGIQKDHVVAVLPGVLDGLLGDVYRVRLTHFEHRDVQLFAHHLQLVDGGGTVHIAGDQQRPLAVLSAASGPPAWRRWWFYRRPARPTSITMVGPLEANVSSVHWSRPSGRSAPR